jgi:hypothetical protein
MNENAHTTDDPVGNSRSAEGRMKTPHSVEQLLHMNIVGSGS